MKILSVALLSILALFAPSNFVMAEEGLFEKLDSNRDGYIAADEVGSERKGLFDRLVRNFDANGDSRLDHAEFTKGITPQAREKLAGENPGEVANTKATKSNPQEMFKRLDRDANGALSQEELPPPVRDHFKRIDANSDGAISPDEFEKAHEHLEKLRREKTGDRPTGGNIEKRAAAIFQSRDANADGKLVLAEVDGEFKEKFQKLLAVVGKESLTKEEFVLAMVKNYAAENPSAKSETSPAPSAAPLRGTFAPPLVKALDSDGNGEISREEIAAASQSLAKLDKNGDGKLTRDELMPPQLENMLNLVKNPLEYVKERFNAADKDGNGKLSRDEAPPFLKERFEKIDANGDGQIEESEFRQMAEKMKERRQGAAKPSSNP